MHHAPNHGDKIVSVHLPPFIWRHRSQPSILTMADKLKGVAVEEVEHIKELTKDAVKSRTYLYPLRASLME